jgi:hypothetical protein
MLATRHVLTVSAALILTLAAPSLAETTTALANVRRVYVEKMENNLDQYITSEISRQFHGTLEVVLDRSKADGIIKGINVGAQQTTKATIQLVDPSGNTVLWSGTGGDREKLFLDLKHGGEQKVAAHLVKELKHAMQPK